MVAQWLECSPLQNLGNFLYPTLPHWQCLSDERLKAVGPFYLVSMPGKVKDITQGVNVSLSPHSSLEKDNYLNHSCVSPGMDCWSKL